MSGFYKLYERLHGAGYDEDQTQAFCRLLTATCRAGLAMMSSQAYKRGKHVTERQFHDDLNPAAPAGSRAGWPR